MQAPAFRGLIENVLLNVSVSSIDMFLYHIHNLVSIRIDFDSIANIDDDMS